jgi:hypothetical protein
MAKQYQSKDPLKDAVAKVTRVNIENMSGLRIAKDFANIGSPFVGFEGNKGDKHKYFQLRVDYDPIKKGHVNVTINGSEKHEYLGEDYTWYEQVLNNINGGAYCGVRRNEKNEWQTAGQEQNPDYIKGMKKYMLRFV